VGVGPISLDGVAVGSAGAVGVPVGVSVGAGGARGAMVAVGVKVGSDVAVLIGLEVTTAASLPKLVKRQACKKASRLSAPAPCKKCLRFILLIGETVRRRR
jgi:hypothetical protein